jgi:hypothetical protein
MDDFGKRAGNVLNDSWLFVLRVDYWQDHGAAHPKIVISDSIS